MAKFTATSVTIANGSTDVTVNSSELIDNIVNGDVFVITGFTGKQVASAFVDGQSNKIIRLNTAWEHPTQTGVAAYVASFYEETVAALLSIKEKITANWTPLLAYGNQATGTVTFAAADSQGQDVTVRTLGQLDSDITALEQSATSSVNDLNTVDSALNDPGGIVEQVAGLTQDLADIDGTLSGYVASASTSESNAATSESNAATSESNAGTSETNAATSESNALTYQNNALTYRNQAEGFKNDAETAAANAAAFEGGNASSLVSIAGANFYNSVNNVPTKTTVGLANVDNTSDANKPISTATQTALNLKANTSALSNYATTTEVSDIEALALAGL